MSGDLNVQRQCQTCLATFPTPQRLQAHLDAYRSEERLLSAQIDKCRAHTSSIAALNVADDVDDGNPLPDKYTRSVSHGIHSSRTCPYDGCNLPTFKTRQSLIRHFETHMACLEACVYCFDRFTTVSKFRKHAQAHRGANDRKNTFMSGMCDDLRAQATLELDRLLATELPPNRLQTTSAKRELGTTDFATETSQPFKKIQTVNSAAVDSVSTFEQDCSDMMVYAESLSSRQPLVTSFDTLDLFAPPLFYDNIRVSVDHFDAPLFMAPQPITSHTTQSGMGNSVDLPVAGIASLSGDTTWVPEDSLYT